MQNPEFSKKLREYTNEMEAIKHQAIIYKPTKA